MVPMKAFVSSLITGLEAERDAARAAVRSLGLDVVRAEDFGASAGTPQQACLAGVRDADVVVLVLGDRYGQVQPSGQSATHEEYREARERVPVLAFVQDGITPEPAQAAFIDEVQSWEQGHFTAGFSSEAQLRDAVTRALHQHLVNATAGPVDVAEVTERARALAASRPQSSGTPELLVAVAGGPLQSVLRPAEIERDDLHQRLLADALTGPAAVLTPTAGTQIQQSAGAVALVQQGVPGMVRLTETGDLLIVQAAVDDTRDFSGIRSIIEEIVQQRITQALRLAAVVLDDVDPAQRLGQVAVVASLRGAGYMPWRTQAEQDRSPNSSTMGGGRSDGAVAELSPPVRRRAALEHETHALAEDLTVRLRQQVQR